MNGKEVTGYSLSYDNDSHKTVLHFPDGTEMTYCCAAHFNHCGDELVSGYFPLNPQTQEIILSQEQMIVEDWDPMGMGVDYYLGKPAENALLCDRINDFFDKLMRIAMKKQQEHK